ncbi:iron-hydroxamate ABC transporter substrate-binding protein [Paenibacillus allorhizosphaerae]|uniref:Iron(3+)-hydroxamate-binding protein FhuD n=1 Tax=Paenibacillus allorhizosphaerae TaxID=2849866 RepID=A0ABN7TJI5_9BACL|nr:iron-hydroxamate ABC transporter substrate-binding protein [Paenibacillus allorhizosphaerae]CAG7638670.1 Iron(3+)-hydroxamate-binding protein FhuD [Paenibacillus allorhizosphaerae]
MLPFQKRSTFCIALCIACMLCILAACSSNQATSEVKKNEVITYEGAKGPIQLPANPQRVVVAVQDYVGDVLALGIKPVGAAGWVFQTPYHQSLLNGTETVGDTSGISYEKILSLTPDVIITYQEDAYEKLSQIAPTVLIPYGKYNYRDRLLEIGKALNKQNEANQWLNRFDQKMQEKKKQLLQSVKPDAKVAIVEITPKELFIYGKSYGRGGDIIYNGLGLRAPAKVEQDAFPQGWAKISLEAIPDYLGQADQLFLGVRDAAVGGADAEAEKRKAEVTSLAVWNNLPAVKAGRVHEYSVQSFYFNDPIALDNQLDFIVNRLTK